MSDEEDEIWESILSGKKDVTNEQLLAFMEVLYEFRKEDNNLLTMYNNRWTELTRRIQILESGNTDLSIDYSNDFYGNGAPVLTETEMTHVANKLDQDSKNFRFVDPREADYFFKAYYFISLISKKVTPQKLYNLLFI